MYILYSKENCPNCDLAKTLFNNRKIEHKIIKIDENTDSEKNTISRLDFLSKYPNVRSMPFVVNEEDGKTFNSLNEILNIKY